MLFQKEIMKEKGTIIDEWKRGTKSIKGLNEGEISRQDER